MWSGLAVLFVDKYEDYGVDEMESGQACLEPDHAISFSPFIWSLFVSSPYRLCIEWRRTHMSALIVTPPRITRFDMIKPLIRSME